MNSEIRCEGLKIVTIGGGNGTAAILEGMKKYTDNITTIVAVTDTGRNTGRVRKDLEVLSPGDTRNCLIALANSEKLMCDLFQYRFDDGHLEGYSFGNLFLATLTKLTGSFEKAVEEASKILKLKGKVLPATFDMVNLCAELEDGKVLKEEDDIIDRHNPEVYLRSPIKKVFHEPKPKVNPKAVEAIKEADIVVLSSGSLFTSLIGNLLMEGMSEAIEESKAKIVYVCNMMTQISQTHEYKASDHLKQVISYLREKPDYVIVNTKNPAGHLIDAYKKEHSGVVENDFESLEKLGVKVIAEDVLDEGAEKKPLWEKLDLLRHDPDKIARVLVGLGKG
jgi:uncharacterized cofD-like protein